VGRKGTGINFQVARRMGIVKLRLLGARLVFSGLWREVVDGRSSEPRIPPRSWTSARIQTPTEACN
jgi:hypothetical protein